MSYKQSLNVCYINRLPQELRREIFGYLFKGLTVHLSRREAYQPLHDARPWSILFTCRKFWFEDWVTFYEFVTVLVDLKPHDGILHEEIGEQRMPFLRHLALRGIRNRLLSLDGNQLPPLLKSLLLIDSMLLGRVTTDGGVRVREIANQVVEFNDFLASNISLLQILVRNPRVKLMLGVFVPDWSDGCRGYIQAPLFPLLALTAQQGTERCARIVDA